MTEHSAPLPTTPPAPHAAHAAAPNNSLNDVKGWLIVLMVVLGIGAAYNFKILMDNMRFGGSEEAALAFEYYPGLKSVLNFENFVLIAAIAAAIASIVLIIKRKKIAKVVITALLLGVIVTGIIDQLWLKSILADSPEALEVVSNSSQMTRALVGAALWVPYLWMSQRVKATLIK